MFVISGVGLAKPSEISPLNDNDPDSLLVRMTTLSIKRALIKAKKEIPISKDLNAGISFLTPSGDGQCEFWASKARLGEPRSRPKKFGSLVHNSAAGRAAIEFGLTGPQIVIMTGDVLNMAKLQLLNNQSRLMIVSAANEVRPIALKRKLWPSPDSLEHESIAFTFILEFSAKKISALENVCELRILEESIDIESHLEDIDAFFKQWKVAARILRKNL